MSPALPGLSPVLPGGPRLVVSTHRPIAGAPSYSEGRQECPPRVWFSPDIDSSKFALHILSDTPEGFWWLRYSLLMIRGALRGRDQVNSAMHLGAVIERVWWCTWRPRSIELQDALGSRDWACLEMHLEAVIEPVGRCTWSPCWIKIGGVLGGGRSGGNWSGGNWSGGGQLGGSQSGGSESGGGRSGGMCDGCWDSIDLLTHNCGNVENWVQQDLQRDWLGAGDSRS